MPTRSSNAEVSFADLNLSPNLLSTLDALGYHEPSPIQKEIIPLILQGRDVIGQAQTGTGKTAAFALPILDKLDTNLNAPQVLVLAPTRELALQVSEAFKSYSKMLKRIKITAVYGGQDFKPQLKQLRDGAQIIVGTPGRIMDHIRRNTLSLTQVRHIVLDEADEMLRMGFVDDIEWIMQQLPEKRQTSLLSATMPKPIRRIAQQYLVNPAEIKIQVKTTTADTIHQRYFYCSREQKFNSLARILEGEIFSAALIFVRTKLNTVELAEKLQQLGYNCAALNGDIAQNQREQTVARLKNANLDIVVATDVAARGLDVERISLVINYDVPFDAESYVHRIGRTGRAGREGNAILLIEPREKHLLKTIERTTNKIIEEMRLPNAAEISAQRIARFKSTLLTTIENTSVTELDFYLNISENFLQENELEVEALVAALTKMAQGKHSLIVHDQPSAKKHSSSKHEQHNDRREQHSERREQKHSKEHKSKNTTRKKHSDTPVETYRIEVGRDHGVAAKHIVGAICNEADIDSQHVGSITIHDTYSVVDLPKGMSNEIFAKLKKIFVLGQALNIAKVNTKSKAVKTQSTKTPSKHKQQVDAPLKKQRAPRRK